MDRLDKILKMGNRVANGRSNRWRNHWQLRRLLCLGAMGVIAACRRTPAGDDWLWQFLERKPVKLVAIALASRNARTVWTVLKSAESWQAARA